MQNGQTLACSKAGNNRSNSLFSFLFFFSYLFFSPIFFFPSITINRLHLDLNKSAAVCFVNISAWVCVN